MAASTSSSLLALLLIALAVLSPSAAALSIPCIPFLPRIPFLPCEELKPLNYPKECLTHVMKMVPPCAGFLTDASVAAPPGACCDGLSAVGDDGAGICYCHVANGDIAKLLLPAKMNVTRMLSVARMCGLNLLDLETLAHNCDTFDVPPMTLPPPPSSPPSDEEAPTPAS